MSKKKQKADELTRLTEELQSVRRESLNASRRGDYRAVARMTCEAARLKRLIVAAEGGQVAALQGLGATLFTGETEETGRYAPALVGA